MPTTQISPPEKIGVVCQNVNGTYLFFAMAPIYLNWCSDNILGNNFKLVQFVQIKIGAEISCTNSNELKPLEAQRPSTHATWLWRNGGVMRRQYRCSDVLSHQIVSL